MPQALTDETKVIAEAEVAVCELGKGAALLDLKTNSYFSLNEVGAVIWGTLDRPVNVSEICDAVVERFEVSKDRCRLDVVSLVDQLYTRGLVRIADAKDV